MQIVVSRSRLATVLVALATLGTSVAFAQPVGTYRWQAQPFCNVIEVAVTQQDGVFTLDGTDDLCGAAERASVFGTAFLNPVGTVGFGITVVTAPGAAPVHLSASIVLSSLNGTWRDSAGNSGSWIFTPASGIGGSPRPVPSGGLAPGSVTTIQLAAAAVGAGQIAPNAVSGANVVDGSLTTADMLDAPRAAFASGIQVIALTTTPAVVRAITMVAPTAGRIIVNASGSFEFTGAGADGARCSLTLGTNLDFTKAFAAQEAVNAMNVVSFASTQGFNVSAGSTTVNLVCDAVGGGTVNMRNSSVTGLFVSGS